MNFFVIKPVYEVNTKVFIGKEEANYAEYDNNDVHNVSKIIKDIFRINKN